ncbi:hypothetical protein [Ammoniphilus sp. YIM 78166]|uniref:hypothetical protein n=1 Tax=Ammoniphilus sp. YIM 78166 TaxID=1644106 RepID=UPI00106FD376|nr:hypothetical protein [Ammoniphilus sp. YIM 78166]
MSKYVIQYTPTGDLLDTEGYLSSPEWIEKDLMMFDNQEDAETYLRDDLFGTDGQGLGHEVIEYQG